SDMLLQHPDLLSLSEFFAVIQPGAFPPGSIGGQELWELLSRPRRRFTLMLRLGISFDEVIWEPGDSTRFTAETGVPPLLLVPRPHRTDAPGALYDEREGWVPPLPAAPAEAQYGRLFDWLCGRLGRTTWVERSGSSLGWLEDLLRRFPHARFLHMYRDGRDCAISMSTHNAYKLTVVSRQLYRRLGVDPFISDEAPVGAVPPALSPFMPETFDRQRYLDLEIPVENM